MTTTPWNGTYREIAGSELDGDSAEYREGIAQTIPASPQRTIGFYGADLGSHAPSAGRVPAFLGLAERTGGVYVENAPSVADALAQTGLDFTVTLEHLQGIGTPTTELTMDGVTTTPSYLALPNHRVTVQNHADGRQVAMTPVSPRYTPVQNTEALAFGQQIIDDGQGALVALGAYGDPVGSRVYAAFKLPEGLTVGGHDPHDLYLTITNTHDKTGGLTALVAPIRLGCTNQTYATFRGKAVPRISLRHTKSAGIRVQEAREALGMAWAYAKEYAVAAEELLAVPQTKDGFLTYARMVFGDKEPAKQSERTRRLVQLRDEQLLAVLASSTNEFGRGTAYAGYQAVVEYTDHVQHVRGGDPAVRRAERILSGQLDALKDRAWTLATV